MTAGTAVRRALGVAGADRPRRPAPAATCGTRGRTADLDCREWFTEEALDRDLDVETDGNGNLWATWCPTASTRRRRRSSPAATSTRCRTAAPTTARSASSRRCSPSTSCARAASTPARPIRVAVFTEEEGSRFGVACLGSRLLTGAVTPDEALALRDRDGVTLADAMTTPAWRSTGVGADPDRLAGIGAFVELHVEQGRALADRTRRSASPARSGRTAAGGCDFTGEGNHAGTTRMADRHDPMLTFAYTVLAANKEARLSGAHATIGRVEAAPNATNAIAAAVTAWLDARAADEPTLAEAGRGDRREGRRARRTATAPRVVVTAESASAETAFSTPACSTRSPTVLAGAPVLPTGAGHDAGVLAGARTDRDAVRPQPDRRLARARPSTPPTPTARPGSWRWPTC